MLCDCIITLAGLHAHVNLFLAAGNLADVVLGYDTIAEYVVRSQISLFSHPRASSSSGVQHGSILFKQNGSSYFGALVGRVANRVAKGRFVLDGKAYRLYINDGKNALHGTLSIVLRSLSFYLPWIH